MNNTTKTKTASKRARASASTKGKRTTKTAKAPTRTMKEPIQFDSERDRPPFYLPTHPTSEDIPDNLRAEARPAPLPKREVSGDGTIIERN